MAITPGDDIETKTSEPLPRGSWFDRAGKMTREVINYFNGKDRLAGEIVSGINRNRQNIVQLETDYQAADGALSTAYIAADAVVAADAASANASLQTTLEAQITSGDTTTLASAQSYTDTEVTAEGAARATDVQTLRAESQRPNLLPAEYQIPIGKTEYEAGQVPLVFAGGSYDAGFGDNPYLLRESVRIRGDGSQARIRVRFTASTGVANMSLPPGRYGFKIAFEARGDYFTHVRAFLTASGGALAASDASAYYLVSDDSSTSFATDTNIYAVGVLDATSATESDCYLEIWFQTDGTNTDTNHLVFPYWAQLERLPDDVDEPGDWSYSAGSSATVSVLKNAFVDEEGGAFATIRLVAAASGSDPAEIEILSGDGSSSVVITGDTFIDGDLMVSGSIVTDGLASNAVTNSQVSQTAGSISLADDTWTTVASFSFTSVGIGVELRGTCTISNSCTTGGTLGLHEWRLRRSGSTLKSGEGTLASTTDGFFDYRVSDIVADYNDIPPAGTYTYVLQVRIGTTTGAVNNRVVYNRYLSAREFKR